MAQDNSGIMGLQDEYFSKGMLPPEMGLEVADGVMQNLNPQLRPAVDGISSEISGELADISDEELDQVIQLVQQLYDDPDNYPQNRAALIQSGELTEEDLPPEYDPEALAMMLYVLRKEKQARSGGMSMQPPSSMPPMAGTAPEMMQPPQGFARGGIAEAARLVAGSGRFGDTMLAHINPREARLLRKHGGSGTINPKTGLPEFIFKFLRKVWQAVWKPVKKFLNSSVGKVVSRIALNVLLPGYGEVIYAGLQTAAQGGEFGDIVKNMAIAGATSYLGGTLRLPGASAPLPSPIQGPLNSLAELTGIKSEVGRMALQQGVVSAGMGLVQGQSLKEAATSGLMAAGTVQAADYLGKVFKPQGQANAKGEVEGNRFLGEKPNAMQDAVGPSVGGRVPIDDRSAFGKFSATNDSDYAAYLKNPNAVSATTSSSVQGPVNVNTSVANQAVGNAGTSTAAPYKPVSVKDAFSTMGEGTKQMFTGDVSGGFNKLTQGAGDLFMPSGPTDDQILDLKKSYMAKDPTLSSDAALKMAQSQGPGLLRTYGPAAAAGLGIMAMAGGFEQPGQGGNPSGPQFRGPTGEDLLRQNPNKYLVQNLPGVNYDAQGNIIGNKEQYPYYRMPDIQVASNYNNAPRFADGGEVMPDYLAEGGTPRMRAVGMGISNLSASRFAPAYMKPVSVRMKGREVQVGVPNVSSSMMGGLQGVATRMKARRDAQAAAAAQAAATAAANAPGQANKLYAANPDQYRPNMEQPQQYAYGGVVGHYASGGPATVQVNPNYRGPMNRPEDTGAKSSPYVFDPNSPQMVEYRNMAQSLTPAARQYLAANNNNGAIADMNMMREAMAYSEQQAARSAPGAARNPGAANTYYAADPEKYRPNMTRPDAGIAGLAMGGYPRKTGQISGPGTETSDSIPAMLSDGEFVMTAKAVRGLGKGSRREGAKKMYALMHQLERNAARG